MRTTTRRAALVGALSVAALSILACGGGTTSSAAPSDAATTADAPTAAPATTAPSDAAPSAAPSDAIVLPSFDLSGMLENLEGIDSYRATITAGGEQVYTATVVTKPVLARDITSVDQRIVIIGDEVWVDFGSGLLPADPQMAQSLLALYDPAVLIGGFAQPGAMTGASDLGTEEKNGVQARHYRVDSSSIAGSLASMPPGSAVDVWIAVDGGFLVSMAVVGLPQGDFAMDVTNINDPANVVERPE